MISLVLAPLRNGIHNCGCLTAAVVSSSSAATIRSSDDVFGILYLVGKSLIVSDTRLPLVYQ